YRQSPNTGWRYQLVRPYGWYRHPVFGDWRYASSVVIEPAEDGRVQAALAGHTMEVTATAGSDGSIRAGLPGAPAAGGWPPASPGVAGASPASPGAGRGAPSRASSRTAVAAPGAREAGRPAQSLSTPGGDRPVPGSQGTAASKNRSWSCS